MSKFSGSGQCALHLSYIHVYIYHKLLALLTDNNGIRNRAETAPHVRVYITVTDRRPLPHRT